MALSRASDSIKLLSRSDHSASPQMGLHELLFAVSPPPVAADENGFGLIRNLRVAVGTCPTIIRKENAIAFLRFRRSPSQFGRVRPSLYNNVNDR